MNRIGKPRLRRCDNRLPFDSVVVGLRPYCVAGRERDANRTTYVYSEDILLASDGVSADVVEID